ncbi:hypothetical protein N9B82_04160 [Saprospiraceae bacterium]|nr:hypothetical protein [Saprospiraceae bacterium]
MFKKIILLSFLYIFSNNVYSQSPWINKKGSLYAQYSFTYLSYGSVINDKLNTIVPADFSTQDITSNIFADYSLTDNLAVLVNLPYKSVRHNDLSLSSFGDPSIKLKYQFMKNIPLSGYLGYTAPLSKREGTLRTGYNQHAAELGLSIGTAKKNSFTFGGLGGRYRSNIPNQILVEFEYGYRFLLTKRQAPFYVIFHVDGVFNTSSVEDMEAGQANLFHNDGEFLSPALKFSYNVFDDFWVNLGVHSAVLVRYFGAASTFTIGFAYKVTK